MKHELYFEHVITIGNLYLEHIFLQFEMEPVFFTCVDEKDNLFICLCSDIRGGQKWVISESSLYTLDRLIAGTMDISSSLCIPEHLVLITRDLQGHEKSCMINTCDVDPLDLPKAGTLLKCDMESAITYFMVKKSNALILNAKCTSPIVNRLLAYSTRLNEMVVHERELVENEKHNVSEHEPHNHHNLDDANTELYLSAAYKKSKEQNAANVELELNANIEKEEVPFKLIAKVAADFRWEDFDDKAVDAMLRLNAPALLLGYMRPIVANITNSSAFPVYNLPFMDFRSFSE